jgi:hypothetical protein
MTGLIAITLCCLANSVTGPVAGVRHRIASQLLDGLSQWWQMPALLLGGLAVVAFVIWTYRRDAVDCPRPVRVGLALLRLGAFAALAVAALDFERTSEREIVQPSRVAVLVDASASMTLTDDREPTRLTQAIDLLESGGLLEELRARHEVALWRFDAAAERIALVPQQSGAGEPPVLDDSTRDRLVARGIETRIGDAVNRVLADEPAATLAGIILLSDGANNAGADPAAAAAKVTAAAVAIQAVGIGSATLPPNVRIADLVAPARVFPGDRFAVTAFLQAQEFAGRTVRVELREGTAGWDTAGGETGGEFDAAVGTRSLRRLDAIDVVLGADGELTPVRFDVPGLPRPGRRSLVVRVTPPAEDRRPADDVQTAEIEVVDRVTRVLLMAGGPGREYQFLRNVLDRDRSCAVDVLLGTRPEGDAPESAGRPGGTLLAGFPDSADQLDRYDAIVAIDYDWRRLDQAARDRLERWVAREAGGLVLMAGGVFMESWLSDPRMQTIRSLHPLELRRPNQLSGAGMAATERPRPLVFTRDGAEAEFLWLASGRVASEVAWSGFPGLYACFEGGPPKPGATVYAELAAAGVGGVQPAIVGQLYGSGSVLYVGSAELWRLRSLDQAAHERIVTQVVRHVAQGRLLRGARQGRLLVDRERAAVGSSVVIRIVLPEGSPAAAQKPTAGIVRGPDGGQLSLPLVAEPGRSDVLRGSLMITREGLWQVDVSLPGTTEPLSRRIQGTLPDRELARPKLDRALLERVTAATGGTVMFLDDTPWSPAAAAALVAAIPDRSRRDYELGAADQDFKRRLNTLLLATGVGLLCLEWIGRRLVRLA